MDACATSWKANSATQLAGLNCAPPIKDLYSQTCLSRTSASMHRGRGSVLGFAAAADTVVLLTSRSFFLRYDLSSGTTPGTKPRTFCKHQLHVACLSQARLSVMCMVFHKRNKHVLVPGRMQHSTLQHAFICNPATTALATFGGACSGRSRAAQGADPALWLLVDGPDWGARALHLAPQPDCVRVALHACPLAQVARPCKAEEHSSVQRSLVTGCNRCLFWVSLELTGSHVLHTCLQWA